MAAARVPFIEGSVSVPGTHLLTLCLLLLPVLQCPLPEHNSSWCTAAAELGVPGLECQTPTYFVPAAVACCSVPGLSITAVGARRQLVLGVPGIEEDVGMLGIHLPDGTFLELVPWAGQVEWSADPWGDWKIWARARGYEALLEASCAEDAGEGGCLVGMLD